MFSLYGKIDFPSQAFNFNNLDNGEYILFTGLLNCFDEVHGDYVKRIKIQVTTSPTVILTIRYIDGTIDTLNTNLSNINQDLDELYFNGNIMGIGGLSTNSDDAYLQADLINAYSRINDENYMFLFRMNSPKDHIFKSLEHVDTVEIKYTRPITHKHIVLDMKRTLSDVPFNYVLLTVLNRYYYVTDATMTNEHYVLDLVEDVLMSFNSLIKQQTAFVERNEFTYDSDKVDDLVTYDYDKDVTYTTITPTNDIYYNSSSLSNVGFWVMLGV